MKENTSSCSRVRVHGNGDAPYASSMPAFDMASVPFSFSGAWLSLSLLDASRAPGGNRGVYLKTHHGGGDTPLLRIAPCSREGAELDAAVTARPDVLTWESGCGRVECAFESGGILRFRGRGMAMRFDSPGLLVCHHDGPGRMTLNYRPVLRRYQAACLAGEMEWEGVWTAKSEVLPRILLREGDGRDGWEAALIEYGSTPPEPDHVSFETCCRRAAASFNAWLDAVPQVREQWENARSLAAYVQWSAMAEPCGLIRRPAMFMSKNWMAKVWNWDNCFNALSLAAAGRAGIAWDQLRLFMDHQDRFGCLPDTLTDLSFHFNFCKPPVHGWTAVRLLERCGEPEKEVSEAVRCALHGWTEWWLAHRRTDGDPLPHYLHGNDSGWDNSTLFDSGRAVIAPDLAAYLCLQCEALARLAARAGDKGASHMWGSRGRELLDALTDRLWLDGRFVGRTADGSGRPVECESLICTLPIVLGSRLPAGMRRATAGRIRSHMTGFGVATEHPESPEYRPDGYWRGPVWAPATYLIVEGLRGAGENALARDIAVRFCRMCAASGFAENYDALTGKGQGDRGYTWSASVFLLLAESLEDQGVVSRHGIVENDRDKEI